VPLSFYEATLTDVFPVEGLMNDDSVLYEKARAAMRAGHLPRRSPDRLWGGSATGVRCAICGVSTRSGEVELELEFTPDSGASRVSYRVHPRCFSIFSNELERDAGQADV
jgi:hypothetical protein